MQVGLDIVPPLHPQGPPLKPGRKRLRLKLKEHQTKKDASVIFFLTKDTALASDPFLVLQPTGTSHTDTELHLTVAVAAASSQGHLSPQDEVSSAAL